MAAIALATEVSGIFTRYMALPPMAAEGAALWVAFTHTFAAHEFSPRLAALSPVPECGKTTLMKLLGHLCPRSLLISNISPAAVYRLTDQYEENAPPTLLLDEGGTYLEQNEAFKGILNSGHSKDAATAVRCAGKEHDYKVEEFSTWMPIGMAKIGRLPAEWSSRSIIIHLKRKRRDEDKRRWRLGDVPELEALSARLAAWAVVATDLLKDPDPKMPSELDNRAADNWRPLFAIADMAGDEWGRIARQAAITLSGDRDVAPGEALLAAIKAAFTAAGRDRLSSEVLCKLMRDGEYEQFRSINPTTLSRSLKVFDIRPRSVRINGQPLKGYMLECFKDAFARYIPTPPAQPATTLQANEINGPRRLEAATDP